MLAGGLFSVQYFQSVSKYTQNCSVFIWFNLYLTRKGPMRKKKPGHKAANVTQSQLVAPLKCHKNKVEGSNLSVCFLQHVPCRRSFRSQNINKKKTSTVLTAYSQRITKSYFIVLPCKCWRSSRRFSGNWLCSSFRGCLCLFFGLCPPPPGDRTIPSQISFV